MAILKVTKKHNKRFNNPFPSKASTTTIPYVQGSLFSNSKTLPLDNKTFPIGNDFQLSCSSNNGGHLSISHLSEAARPIWSTIPGQAFVSAAIADTEVEECRGSFLVKDRDVHLVCNHQIIDDIRVINHHSVDYHAESYQGLDSDQKTDSEEEKVPSLVITGRLFSVTKKSRRFQKHGIQASIQFEAKGPSVYARYWVALSQKTNHQVGFQVKIEKPSFISPKQVPQPRASRVYRGFKKRPSNRKKRLGWCWYLSRPRGFVLVSSVEEEEMGNFEVPNAEEFNRVWLTYASDENERFYGFGEQFSHMNFKGKRVPILVQEQGIGRGDQPITMAANLVSYRYFKAPSSYHTPNSM